MSELSQEAFCDWIRQTYGCNAQFVGRQHVHEQYDGLPAWDGDVLVFKLLNHPTAVHCYAWEEDGCITAVLHSGDITSPAKAVRASILGELDPPRKHE